MLSWLPSEAEQAEHYSQLAVTEYADTSGPTWAFGDQAGSQCDLAISRIARGELEGAAEAVAPVLELSAEQRINGIITSVQHVHQALSRSAIAGSAGELRDQIEDFTHTPMSALPR